MAIITATVTVDFDANQAGDHRVCWRIQDSGDDYNCDTVVNCVGGGANCEVDIEIDVNDTSCDGVVTFEGYIQPTCEDILSTNGRLDWVTTFTPTLACLRYEILCEEGAIDGFTITDGGEQYLDSEAVVVTRDPEDGAVGDAIISITSVGDGLIQSISSLLDGGTQYTVSDVLTIVDGAGTGSGGTITVDNVNGGGTITGYTLTTGGTDYVGPFTFTGGTGTGADFEIVSVTDYDVFGEIQGFTITNGGLYEIPPVITVTTTDGVDLDVTPTLEACGAYNNIGADCDGGDAISLSSGLDVGVTWATCLNATLASAVPSRYATPVQTGCCIPSDTEDDPNLSCVDYHIDNQTGAPVDVHITTCEGDDTTQTIADATQVAVCAVDDGVLDPNVTGLTIDKVGTPCS